MRTPWPVGAVVGLTALITGILLLRAVKDGVAVAARDLGVEPAQLYAWRAKAAQHDQVTEVQQLQQSELARLKRELARLEEENAFLKKAAAYFAKLPK